MAHYLETSNRQRVQEYYDRIWNGKDVEALADFVRPDCIQHNPGLTDGCAALHAFMGALFQALPQCRFHVARMVAEDDLVVAHCLFRATPDDRGTAVVDVYRLRDGMLAEHWDLKEPVPETSANANGMV